MKESEKQLALAAIENILNRLNLLQQYLEGDKFMDAKSEMLPLQIRFDILKSAFNDNP